MPETFELIPLSRISESATNPRLSYDEAKLQELADSIKSHGILQPILVRPKDEAFEIIAGSRRFRASRLAAVEHIPCRVIEMEDDQVLEVQIIENAQREDVHPIEEAMGYAMIFARGIYDVEQIALKVGKSVETVRRRLTLTKLTPEVAHTLRDKEIAIKGMELLSSVAENDQAEIAKALSYRHSISNIRYEIERRSGVLESARWNLAQLNVFPGAPACEGCAFNTGTHGTLFEELRSGTEQKPICTNRSCHQRKHEAWLQGIIDRAVVEHGEITKLSDSWYGTELPGLLPSREWNRVSKPAKDTEVGVIVQGNGLGQVVHFKRAVKGSAGSSSDDTGKRADRLAELRGFKVQCTYRRMLFDRIMEFIDAESADFAINILSRPENLALMVASIAANGTQSVWDSKDVARHPGLDLAKAAIGLTKSSITYDHEVKPKKLNSDMRAVIKSLFVMATYHEIAVNDGQKKTPMPVLDGCARALSIDSAEILKQAEAKFPVRKKKEVA